MDGDLNGFQDIGAPLIKGNVTIPYCHDQHTIQCSLTQETRIYMVYGWVSQRFSRYLSTSGLNVIKLLSTVDHLLFARDLIPR
jgi:hypothetical protein